ncbi:hypothetical protein [Bacillus cereus]|uniref:hypothetical protein n=1 Tax=Bacillus cereus TaxID=1396 RepID=UPI000C2911CA|nr:hypothetical protein [Bacillus cereus]
MLMTWNREHLSDKQCIEHALTMWKEWRMSKKETYTDELAIVGTMYVINHMKLRKHQVSLLLDFFDEYLYLLGSGEDHAEEFYKTIMRM